eukprot:403335780
MPPKKKGAKKGAKDQQADDEYVEVPDQSQPVEEIQAAQVSTTQAQPQVQIQAQQDLNDAGNQAQLQQNSLVSQPATQSNNGSANLQINSNGQSRVITNTANQSNGLPHVSQRVVNVNAQHGSNELVIGDVAELSLREKKELRKQRFKTGDTHLTTADALQSQKEEQEKRLARAQKFGLNTSETEEQKRQERAVKFGLISASAVTGAKPSKQEMDEKRKERAQRFGLTTADDEEEKRLKRLERFGQSLENVPGQRTIKRLKQ